MFFFIFLSFSNLNFERCNLRHWPITDFVLCNLSCVHSNYIKYLVILWSQLFSCLVNVWTDISIPSQNNKIVSLCWYFSMISLMNANVLMSKTNSSQLFHMLSLIFYKQYNSLNSKLFYYTLATNDLVIS